MCRQYSVRWAGDEYTSRSYGSQTSIDVFEIAHAVLVAPLDDLQAVDIPGQIEQDVAGGKVLLQHAAEVFGRDPHAVELYSLGNPGLHERRLLLEIDDRHILRRNGDVLEQDRQRALGHRPEADHQNALLVLNHSACSRRILLKLPILLWGMRRVNWCGGWGSV